MTQTRLAPDALAALHARLEAANRKVAARFPGDSALRQPVHTLYGGAHLFKADTARKVGAVALRALSEHAPSFAAFARAMGLEGAAGLPEDEAQIATLGAMIEADPAELRSSWPAAWLAWAVHTHVVEKLGREPVEDLRIDFEDGYGARPDAEEDGHAAAAAREVAAGLAAGSLPPFLGIRIKPLSEELRARALRTLDVFFTALAAATGGALPPGFVVTLPKITAPEQVAALADALGQLEAALGLGQGAVKLEIMVETPQALVGPAGEMALPGLVAAARGRCVAAHLGAYDYSSLLDIAAPHQRLDHPSCDFVRHLMQVCLAGTGVRLSDGATTLLPLPIHRAAPGGPPLGPAQLLENRGAIHRAWRAHAEQVSRALAGGFYQGWDLHPAQLPARYAAVHAFFLGALEPAAERLRRFVDRAAQATAKGQVFDDAATGQGLLAFFLRAVACGALGEAEAAEATTLSIEELRGRSFAKIAAARR